jgi:hypothetical protein
VVAYDRDETEADEDEDGAESVAPSLASPAKATAVADWDVPTTDAEGHAQALSKRAEALLDGWMEKQGELRSRRKRGFKLFYQLNPPHPSSNPEKLSRPAGLS